MYHGSREEFKFFPAICFTDSFDSASSYGDTITEVEIDESKLSILEIELSSEQIRECWDDNEWPCDRQKDVEQRIAEGYGAVRYSDADESGCEHDCIRILTADAFAKAVTVVSLTATEN